MEAAITLAALSGLILLTLGIFRLGFLANFLSHPVIAGFITATGFLIAAGQLKHVLGVKSEGETLDRNHDVARPHDRRHEHADSGDRRDVHCLSLLGSQRAQA